MAWSKEITTGVPEIYKQIDHRAINCRVRRQQMPKNRQSQSRKKFNGWKASAFATGTMHASIEGSCAEGLTAEQKVEEVMQKVANACDSAMPRNEKEKQSRAAPCRVAQDQEAIRAG